MNLPLPARVSGPSSPQGKWSHGLLIALILIGFARLVWQLDTKPLWWDESLSLQRAESDWSALLLGIIVIDDGAGQLPTRDQHPPLFFSLLGLLLRLAGSDEFVLRLPSAMAATLAVPVSWALGRRLVRCGSLPAAAPLWSALLLAVSPFYLWYGQEARPYLLWALVTLLSTYALLRWLTAGPDHSRQALSLYLLSLLLLAALHYFSALLVPVHAAAIYLRLAARAGPRRALLAAGLLLAVAALLSAIGAWWLLSQPGAGTNLAYIPMGILARDLINAFSLGLSVDLSQVWWIDVCFATLALLGAVWGVANRQRLRQFGWLLPATLLIPVTGLFLVNLVQPVYMNARHLSLVSGVYLLLVSAGLGAIGRLRFWLSGVAALALVAAMLLSSAAYYSQPTYRKGADLPLLGDYLRQELLPGDLLLLNPPFAERLFRYYLPLALIEERQTAGTEVAWRAAPMVRISWDETFAELADLHSRYRRIWLVTEGTFPFADPERRVEQWLQQRSMRIWDYVYFSPNAYLELDLFLTRPPVGSALPATGLVAVGAVFGERIGLQGYTVGPQLAPGSALPVTLYWESLAPMPVPYKYLLQLVSADQVVGLVEREPYNGFLPTTGWQPGMLIAEQSAIPVPHGWQPGVADTLHLAWYAADTLQKLPVRGYDGTAVAPGGETLLLPALQSSE